MLDWRDFSREIQTELNKAKNDGVATIDTVKLLGFLSILENDYIQLDKYSILDEINKTKEIPEEKYLDLVVEKSASQIAQMFDKGAAYTNLLITAGYATFFGLWSINKDFLDDHTRIWSATFLIISAMSFVFFEVYKTLMFNFNLLKRSKAVQKASHMKSFKLQAEIIVESEKRGEWYNIAFIPVWVVTSTISIGTASAGVGLLFWYFIFHL